jgi:hypothetical protein
VVFPNNRVTTGFCGIKFNIQNSGTEIYLEGGLFNGRGALFTSDDTRPRIEVVGTSGSFEMSGQSINGFEQIIFTSSVVATSCSFSNGNLITAAGADLSGSTISVGTGAVALLWDVSVDTSGKLDNTRFVSSGTGHAIELGANTPSEITLNNAIFSGYGADDTTNAAIYNNSGKEITVYVVGGSAPTVRNGTGATTIVVVGITTFSFTVRAFDGSLLTGYEWRLYEADPVLGIIGTVELAGEEVASLSSQSYNYSYSGDVDVALQIIDDDHVEFLLYTTLTNSNQSVVVNLVLEENA